MLETMLQLNWYVATGVLILEIGFLGKLLSLLIVTFGKGKLKTQYLSLVDNVARDIKNKFSLDVLSARFLVFCIFVFSLASSIMTLVYSEIFLQEPCALCWWQRVFMYGIVVLSGQSLWCKTEKNVREYILSFSVFGFLFALYQHFEQILALYGTHLPCPVSAVDCSKMTVFEYGHITFPWMAVVLFAFFVVIVLLQKKLEGRN
jgi:disulfide bond formation protein DsbB